MECKEMYEICKISWGRKQFSGKIYSLTLATFVIMELLDFSGEKLVKHRLLLATSCYSIFSFMLLDQIFKLKIS